MADLGSGVDVDFAQNADVVSDPYGRHRGRVAHAWLRRYDAGRQKHVADAGGDVGQGIEPRP